MTSNEIKLDQKATNYLKDKIGGQGGTTVIANPTLSGDEDALTGLEVDGVKYAVSSGNSLYQHFIKLNFPVPYQSIVITLLTNDDTPFTKDTLRDYLYTRGITNNPNTIATMVIVSDGTNFYLHRTLWATLTTISVVVSPVGTTTGTQINAISISDNVLPL